MLLEFDLWEDVSSKAVLLKKCAKKYSQRTILVIVLDHSSLTLTQNCIAFHLRFFKRESSNGREKSR